MQKNRHLKNIRRAEKNDREPLKIAVFRGDFENDFYSTALKIGRGVAGCPRRGGSERPYERSKGKTTVLHLRRDADGSEGETSPLNNFFCKETGSPCNRAHVRDVFHCGKFCKRIVAHFVFDVDDIVGDVAAVLVYHARDIE